MSYPNPKQGEGQEAELLPNNAHDVQDAEAIQLPAKSRCRSTRWKRIVKVGGLLTFVAALFTTTFVLIPRYFWSSFKDFGPGEHQDYILPWRKGIECKEHAQWWQSEAIENNRRRTSYGNLTVPLNKDGLLPLVKGEVSGSVDFVEDDSLVNEAYVDLHVEYDSRTFGKTRFCTLQNPYDSSSGVGIFGSGRPGKEKETMAKITVHMPKLESPKMDNMFVVVPNMEVNFPTDFKIKSTILAVKSRKAPSHVTNVECESCEFKISDGPIRGNFTVRDKLILKTKSGAIDANITMISNTTDANHGPIVDITTTTGSINADFTLVAIDAETEEKVPSGGVYRIATRTRHAPVRLEIVDAPVESILDLWSKNMWGPLKVWLHPTYQGWFRSEAFIGDTPLGIVGGAEDPSGNGRKRNLFWNGWSIPPGIKHVLSGEVWWGDRQHYPYDQIASSVRLKAIIGQPLVFVHT